MCLCCLATQVPLTFADITPEPSQPPGSDTRHRASLRRGRCFGMSNPRHFQSIGTHGKASAAFRASSQKGLVAADCLGCSVTDVRCSCEVLSSARSHPRGDGAAGLACVEASGALRVCSRAKRIPSAALLITASPGDTPSPAKQMG